MAVLTAHQKHRLKSLGPPAEACDLGARLAKLDSDGSYTGTLSDSVALSAGEIVVGQADDVGDPKTLSGDATIDAAGALTIAANAVSAAKLAAAVQDMIPAVAVTSVDGEDSDTATVTVQVNDAGGNALAANAMVTVWTAATSMGVPAAPGTSMAPDSGGAKGLQLKALTANAMLVCLTNASGLLELDIANGAVTSNDLFVMVAVGGLVVATEIIITAGA